MTERALIDAAIAGDEGAYAKVIDPFRIGLRGYCYRMLGSVQDAEDATQEALFRAWRGLASFQHRSSLRSWLYAIAANVCLRMLERRPPRVLPIEYGPPGDPHQPLAEAHDDSTWIEPYREDRLGLHSEPAGPEAGYAQSETVELAFIAALQHLPARQRAVLILREVLGFSAAEVATALDTSPASVYSALQRAHASVDRRVPEPSQLATLRSLGDERLREIADAYVQAWEDHDVDRIVSMLTETATVGMPPTPTWYRGREAIAAFLESRPLSGDLIWRLTPASANGQLAADAQLWDPDTHSFRPHHTAVLTLDGELIDQVTTFLRPWALTVARRPG